MGSYCTLSVSNYEILSMKSQADPIIMTVFRDSDRRSYSSWDNDYPEDLDDVEETYEYAATARMCIERLEVMGFTLQKAKADFESGVEGWSEYGRDYPLFGIPDDYCFSEWMSAFSKIGERKLSRSNYRDAVDRETQPTIHYMMSHDNCDGDFWFGFPYSDLRFVLRAILESLHSDCEVVLGYTDLVHGGYCSPDDELCGLAINELGNQYVINDRIVLLTEGSTDSLILEASLKLLYPHLREYYSFMDFGAAKAPGGSGVLTNTVRAFIGSGIRNRMIALFDNDTAGRSAMKQLVALSLPDNMKIMRLPDIPIARNYPTIGPQGLVVMDVNGLACSIEMYLGTEVLTLPSGQLAPVQWRGLDTALKEYQGEVMDKESLQSRFRKVVAEQHRNPLLVEQHDWKDMRAILEMIFAAFH
jgi:hypothetical protein